jgi:putative DNA primase/helicase
MTAEEIAVALGDALRMGRAWRCRCPLHGGHSLDVRDGDAGRILATCWGGCDRLAVLTELRRMGLIGSGARGRRLYYAPRIVSAPRRDDDAGRAARALNIWHEARPGAGTIAARYLASRGIVLEQWPASLRFRSRCPRPRDEAGNPLAPLPAMVALVEHVERGSVAVHATYLRADGSGKADLPKEKQRACFGPVAGGAVRLCTPRAGEWHAVGEGIESVLSVAVACSMPAWAALSAGAIKNLILPPEITHVVICADHDRSGVGQRAAHDAAARWLAEGRRVRIALPPAPGTDFADILAADMSLTAEARHVA